MQAGADIEEGVGGNADRGDRDREHGKRPRPLPEAHHDRAEQENPADHDQAGSAEADGDQQEPQRAQCRPLRELAAPLDGIRRRRGSQRVEDEERNRGPRQQRQQVVSDRQGRDIGDEQEQVRRARSAPCPQIAPAHDQPGNRGDAECRDGIDLGLVAVLPAGEGERGEQRGGRRPTHPDHPRFSGQHAIRDEKQTPGAGRREAGAHQIQAPRILTGGHQIRPDVAHHNKQRRARLMRYAEHVGGGDEFARIPQRDGGCEGDHIADEDQERGNRGLPVWRAMRRIRQAESHARRPRDERRHQRADRAPAAA